MAGLTGDASKISFIFIQFSLLGVLCKFMRNECLNYKYVYESRHPLKRLITKVADSKIKNIKLKIKFILRILA